MLPACQLLPKAAEDFFQKRSPNTAGWKPAPLTIHLIFFRTRKGGELDALICAALLIFWVRFDGEDGDVSFVRAIRPKQSPGGRRVVLQIGLKNLHPIFSREVVNLVRGQTVVPGILAQVTERLHELLEKFLPVLVQLSLLLTGGEVY